MNRSVVLFVEDARGVSIKDAAEMLGLKFTGGRGDEHPQPCPSCGGTDCFAFNTRKNKWNCRAGSVGGNDAIGMAAHVLGLDTRKQAELLEACAAILGEAVPEGEGESDDERRRRAKRLAERRQLNFVKAAAQERSALSFREKEKRRARGIFQNASPRWRGSTVETYLARRMGRNRIDAADAVVHLRFSESQTYWHGTDAFGRPADHYCGPAMIAAYEDSGRQLIGCHITWIDLSNSLKFRPDLGRDKRGNALPAKKMRGTKKGGLIPVAGEQDAARWVVAEGIETVFAVALAEGFRPGTFYAAAGDIGNLTGPAMRWGGFSHPTLKKPDRNGKERAMRVPAPYPDPERLEEAFPVYGHVRECVLLGERDSEAIATAAAMARGRKRIELLLPECLVALAWPPEGFGDFCDLVAAGSEAA